MLPASQRSGLTRVEVIVVAGIGAISGALLFPALEKARAAIGSQACQNNLRQIGLATLNYHDTYDRFAPGMDNQEVGELIRLLLFVNRDDLYKNFSMQGISFTTKTPTTSRQRMGRMMFPGHPICMAVKGK